MRPARPASSRKSSAGWKTSCASMWASRGRAALASSSTSRFSTLRPAPPSTMRPCASAMRSRPVTTSCRSWRVERHRAGDERRRQEVLARARCRRRRAGRSARRPAAWCSRRRRGRARAAARRGGRSRSPRARRRPCTASRTRSIRAAVARAGGRGVGGVEAGAARASPAAARAAPRRRGCRGRSAIGSGGSMRLGDGEGRAVGEDAARLGHARCARPRAWPASSVERAEAPGLQLRRPAARRAPAPRCGGPAAGSAAAGGRAPPTRAPCSPPLMPARPRVTTVCSARPPGPSVTLAVTALPGADRHRRAPDLAGRVAQRARRGRAASPRARW